MIIQPEIADTLRFAMAVALFGMGLVSCAAGLWTILSQEYQRTLKGLALQANRLHARGLSEISVGPIIDASARLVEAVNQLIRTAMGIGAFLCLVGVGLCVVAFWILTSAR